jgi:hypothetical protein
LILLPLRADLLSSLQYEIPCSNYLDYDDLFIFQVKIGSGRSHDIWHCIVIGFDNGWVHFVTENGQLLIAKQFIPEQPVIKIRVLNAIPPKRAKFPALTVPKLSELLIIYESTVVSVDSNVLMSCLISNRAEAVQARSKETSFSNGNLPARKWKVRLFMGPSI